MRLTRILGVLRANIFVADIKYILVHEGSTRCHLTEEADLDWLANLDTLALLHEDLAGVLASVSAIQTGHPVLFRVVSLLEWLQRGHQVVSTSDTVSNHSLSNTCRDSTLDDGRHRVHGSDDLALILRRDVKLDLLEKVFGSTEATNNQHILPRISQCHHTRRCLKRLT